MDDFERHTTFGATRNNYEFRYIFGSGMAMQMVKNMKQLGCASTQLEIQNAGRGEERGRA